MLKQSCISYAWEEEVKALGFRTGVSLHSHTSASEETLSFVHQMGIELPFASYLFAHYTRIARERHNITLDFLSAHWRPPLLPKMAFDLERAQIEALGLEAMISITDHDNIQAPLLLRTISAARRIPVSVEWTTPFGKTAFHLGIHNIPSDAALDWMQRFERFTAAPGEERLGPMLRELDAIPQVLIVLNHPLWDLYKVGDRDHRAELDRFLRNNNVHALELNGLRHARENRDVVQLARRWNQTLISGGDRHGLEPNANINLTNASSFTDFVREIRVERRSHVLFLDQYRKPWEQRILESTLDAITDHPHFSPGWQRWDERAFHKDADGVMRPMAELWSNGRMPVAMRLFIGFIRLFRFRTLARTLSLTCPGVNQASIDAGLLQDAA